MVLKKSGSKWKDVPPGKAPKKVKSDLKVPPATSNVRLTGEVVDRVQARRPLQRLRGEHLRPRCRPAADIQQRRDEGDGFRPALGVRTVVAVYRNKGTELAYESG